MIRLNERYLVDKKGKRVSVQLDVKAYHKLLKELEELESLRAYDAAKASREKSIPLEKAFKEIERDRK